MKQYLWNEVIESVIVPLISNKIFTNLFFLGLLIRSCVFTLELFLFWYQDDLTLLLLLLCISIKATR